MIYFRKKQPVGKLQEFSASQILREFNLRRLFRSPKKLPFLTILATGKFWHFQVWHFHKIKIQILQNYQTGSFWLSEITQKWFHVKSNWSNWTFDVLWDIFVKRKWTFTLGSKRNNGSTLEMLSFCSLCVYYL